MVSQMEEQLVLIEGVRREPPACYPHVVEALEIAMELQPEMKSWSVERLVGHINRSAKRPPDATPEDIVRAVRIYRERTTTHL